MSSDKAKESKRREATGPEEARLVAKGILACMEKIRSGKMRTITLRQAVQEGVFD